VEPICLQGRTLCGDDLAAIRALIAQHPDPIVLAHERIERNLFEAHVAPAFFFDGEQAQKLIESQGERGLKRAVEVMFGTVPSRSS
jgi:hypothetical protein